MNFKLKLCLLPLLIFLINWYHSPVWTLASLMEFSISALSFGLSVQFVILHLLISVCTHFLYMFFGRPLSKLTWGLLLNT